MKWGGRERAGGFTRQGRWLALVAAATLALVLGVGAQELGGAGTVQGVVLDPTGGVMQAVTVVVSNSLTGFRREVPTDTMGRFVVRNLAPNPYRLEVAAQGFATLIQDIDVRSAIPVELKLSLQLEGTTASVNVVGSAGDLAERDPTAHTDIDQNIVAKLPVETAGGLNEVITKMAPGVVADSNGFFHPIGDHAQTQFSIDNQPVTDQQSRIYSNQISPDAVQSMEIITGVAPAEYGDKTSLVVQVITKSGLGQPKPTGSVNLGYGSFKSPTFNLDFGGGSPKVGDFVSISGFRTDRFLDPPEFEARHDGGNSLSVFNRFDLHPDDRNTFRLNVHAARSSFDVPTTYDAAAVGQAQHQAITTFNVAPGYSRVLSSRALFTANGFVRRDQLTYSPSADPTADLPASVSQDRTLTNMGVKVDVAYTAGAHNLKVGGTVSGTSLHERFTLGITDPTDPAFAGPDGVTFDPTFAPYDLTRGGTPLNYDQSATITQQAVYIQDDVKAGNVTVKMGLRWDRYDGLVSKSLLQPRLGVSYALPGTGTVLRASYGRTMETPYNENLLLSSGYGLNGLFGAGAPLAPGVRNEGEVGVQQAFGRWVVADFGYFNKRTDNGYDFSVLFNTPIVFPVAWDHSRIDGFTGRINLVEHNGFSAFVVMAHTNAIFSPPGTGGVLLEAPGGDFRIDHDQKFNATTGVQYAFAKPFGGWVSLNWRYDSGLVAGSVPDYATALTFTGDQQAAIGLFCGSTVATVSAPITSCTSSNRGASRVVIPADGTADDVNNPPRIAPRHLLDLGAGVNNLLNGKRAQLRVKFSVVNLTNTEALYNFLSTFSGTHFVTPRAYTVQLGVTF